MVFGECDAGNGGAWVAGIVGSCGIDGNRGGGVEWRFGGYVGEVLCQGDGRVWSWKSNTDG